MLVGKVDVSRKRIEKYGSRVVCVGFVILEFLWMWSWFFDIGFVRLGIVFFL